MQVLGCINTEDASENQVAWTSDTAWEEGEAAHALWKTRRKTYMHIWTHGLFLYCCYLKGFSEHTSPHPALLQFSEAKRQVGSKKQRAGKMIG